MNEDAQSDIPEPRILTDDETYRRRREHASTTGPKTIGLCAIRDCPHPANYGPFCPDHRRQYAPEPAVAAADLTGDDIAELRAQVEADAAPLFVIAMNWIARRQVERLGYDNDALAAGMERIRGELA